MDSKTIDEQISEVIDTLEHQEWLTVQTNQIVNDWLEEAAGLPITIGLSKLGFQIINGLEAGYRAGLKAGLESITHDNACYHEVITLR